MLRDFLRGRDPAAKVWPGNDRAPTASWYKHGADIRHDLAEADIKHIDGTNGH